MYKRVAILFLLAVGLVVIRTWCTRQPEAPNAEATFLGRGIPAKKPLAALAVNPLIVQLQNKEFNTQTRENAASALGGLNDLRAVDPLIAVLKDKDEPVELRCAAAYALEKLKCYKAQKALDEVKNDNEEVIKVREAATPYHELYP